MLMLQVIKGPDRGRVYPLPEGEPQLIGRSTEALPMEDTAVSRRHAELTPDDGTWYIRDLDSANGTMVNGEPLTGRRKLSPGDELACGETVFRLIDSNRDIGGPIGSLEQERLASVGQTVATISHAIKNILQGLRGAAGAIELAISRGDLDMAREGWPILGRNLDRIYDLTYNMLAFTRVRCLEPREESLDPLLKEVVQLVDPLALRKKVKIDLEIEEPLSPISCDANSLHQALLNLLLNAVEAVPAKSGRIIVRARTEPLGVWIEIIDNGPGIDRERLEDVFLPFASTKGQRGTGLGLPVTRQIIEGHGGHIELDSDGESGASFRLFLPASGPLDPGETTGPIPVENPPAVEDEFE